MLFSAKLLSNTNCNEKFKLTTSGSKIETTFQFSLKICVLKGYLVRYVLFTYDTSIEYSVYNKRHLNVYNGLVFSCPTLNHFVDRGIPITSSSGHDPHHPHRQEFHLLSGRGYHE